MEPMRRQSAKAGVQAPGFAGAARCSSFGCSWTAPGCETTAKLLDGRILPWETEETTDEKPQQPAADSFVLRTSGEMMPDKTLPVLGGDYEAAVRFFQEKDYDKAEPIFEHIAENKKNTFQAMELVRSTRPSVCTGRRKFPEASANYILLLNNFPSPAKGRDARERLFAIANYWLDETRDDIEAEKEVKEGKRMNTWWPTVRVHIWDETKPTFDTEGRAIKGARNRVHDRSPE